VIGPQNYIGLVLAEADAGAVMDYLRRICQRISAE